MFWILAAVAVVVVIGMFVYRNCRMSYFESGRYKKFFHDKLGIHVPCTLDLWNGYSRTTICRYCGHLIEKKNHRWKHATAKKGTCIRKKFGVDHGVIVGMDSNGNYIWGNNPYMKH